MLKDEYFAETALTLLQKMLIKNKSILLISPEPWDHLFVSKHQYATHLGARGNQVYFLNPPSREMSCHPTDFKNVYTVHYRGFIKGLRFMPRFLQRWLIRQKFEEIQKLCGVKFDLVWSFDNSVFFDFSALPKEVYCISHIVDLNQDFNTASASSTACICFGVVSAIVERHKLYNDNSYLVKHAVQNIPDVFSIVKLPGNNAKKAIYAGNLTMPHIDWDLLFQLIIENTTTDFLLVGSGHPKEHIENQLKSYSHVYLLPPVKSNELIHYLNAADVLLLIYKPEYYSIYASPHKMMEYIASGKIVLATWNYEYLKLLQTGLIKMTKVQNEFLFQFKEVTQNLLLWNSNEKQIARKLFAKQNTYDKRIDAIEKIINSTND